MMVDEFLSEVRGERAYDDWGMLLISLEYQQAPGHACHSD
jgi:hypothetical protein